MKRPSPNRGLAEQVAAGDCFVVFTRAEAEEAYAAVMYARRGLLLERRDRLSRVIGKLHDSLQPADSVR